MCTNMKNPDTLTLMEEHPKLMNLSSDSYVDFTRIYNKHIAALDHIKNRLSDVEKWSTRKNSSALIDKDLQNSPLILENPRTISIEEIRDGQCVALQAQPKLGEATTQPGTKRSIEQMGESSNSNPTKKPRTGDSPILDEIYKGGNKPFKRESVENNL